MTNDSRLVSYVEFRDQEARMPKARSIAWADFRQVLTTHKTREEKGGACFSPVVYKESATRGNAGVEVVTCFIVDIDDGVSPDTLRPLWQGLEWCLYSSFSSTAEKPKYRVIFPFSNPIPAADWGRVWRKMVYHLTEGHADVVAKDAARIYFLPSASHATIDQAFIDAGSGEFLNPDNYPDPPAFERISDIINRGPALGVNKEDGKGKPGYDFNEKATPEEILALLERAGWKEDHRKGSAIYLTRPGKSEGISGVIGFPGEAATVFYCFSSSAAPLEGGKVYAPFGLLTFLEFNGDFIASTRELGTRGYGDQVTAIETSHLPRAEERKPWKPGETNLPVIVVTNRQDRQIADETWEALLEQNRPPCLFSRGTGLARVGYDADAHRAIVEPIDEQRILHRMRRVADFVTVRASKNEDEEPKQSHTPPPSRIAKDMLVDAERIGGLPSLRGIVYAPVIGPSGVIIAQPGYDQLSRLWLECPRVHIKQDAEVEDAKEASKRLFDRGGVFGEFPFASDTDKAHFVAMALTPYLRPYINGTAPMFITEAPERGTGKSLAVRNAIRLFDPVPRAWNAPTAREAKDAEAEWDKLLGTALKTGVSSLFFDNVRGALVSTALEGLTTSTDPWSTRLLGSSTEIVVWPELLTIFGTSNNTEANRDMSRRSLIVRLDANMERPEMRQGFAISDLDAYVSANRLEILSDVMTIFSAWIRQGRPEWTERTKGTYERWARVVGGILNMIGIDGFLDDEEDRQATMDPETQRWSSFVTLWHQNHGAKRVYARDLVPQAETAEIIPDALDRGASRRLGRMITQNRDRVIAGWRIEAKIDSDSKVMRFFLSSPEIYGVTGFPGIKTPTTHNPFLQTDCNDSNKNAIGQGGRNDTGEPRNPVTLEFEEVFAE